MPNPIASPILPLTLALMRTASNKNSVSYNIVTGNQSFFFFFTESIACSNQMNFHLKKLKSGWDECSETHRHAELYQVSIEKLKYCC